MAIDAIVRSYNGGFLPDIILLTLRRRCQLNGLLVLSGVVVVVVVGVPSH